MTPIFEAIVDEYGPPDEQQPFTPSEIATIRSLVPAPTADVFVEMGRAVFRKGRVQSCHPDDLRGVLALVFGADKDFSHRNCFAFAYSAFGMISFWMKGFGYGNVNLYFGDVSASSFVQNQPVDERGSNSIITPFWISDESLDMPDERGAGLFKRATKKLGQIEIGECFGFVPALGFGGPRVLGNLRRLKAPEHFSIVAQTMGYGLVESQDAGTLVRIREIGPR